MISLKNHRRHGATQEPNYIEALAELARRRGRGLDFDTTIKVITAAAREGKFISYGQVAEASGAVWNQVRYAIGPHLDGLIEYCLRRQMPLLSSIVVNQPNLHTGQLEPDSLKGFVVGVRGLGVSVTDEKQFLKDAQAAVFEWARSSGNTT
jgi:hypothetical protein